MTPMVALRETRIDLHAIGANIDDAIAQVSARVPSGTRRLQGAVYDEDQTSTSPSAHDLIR